MTFHKGQRVIYNGTYVGTVTALYEAAENPNDNRVYVKSGNLVLRARPSELQPAKR